MNNPLNYLLEKDKIIETITNLFVFTDNRDWENVKKCFTDNVFFDMTSTGAEKAEILMPSQITEAWNKGLIPLEAIHHQAGNYKIEVEENTANAFCYGIALHYRKTKSGKNTRTFVGSYNLHLTKIEMHWLIDSFRYNLKFIDGNPDLENDN
jgi:hypothetical protein